MGCQESMMDSPPVMAKFDSTASQEDTKLELHKFIERQRGDIFQLYHFSRVLSRGSGIIRQVLERNSRLKRICKIKTISKQMHLIQAFQEVEILKNLNHPNIVQVIQYFNQQSFLYLVLEQIPGKSICQMLCEDYSRNLTTILQIIRQILIALCFCHQKGYVHKAINPQHVMIVRLQKNNGLLIKLVGFGKAHKIGAPIISTSIGHTTVFNAPESQNQKEADKQDIWGCGVIFLELLSGERSFPGLIDNKSIIIEDIVNRQPLTALQKETYIDFISKMLELSPSKRMSASQALEHNIFKLGKESQQVCDKKAQVVLEGLLHYRVQMNLKALFAMYASLNILSVEQKSQNLIEFYNLDKNKDGKIDFDELVQGLQNTFGMDYESAKSNVSKIFEQCNKSSENFIEFNDYVTATTFMRKEVCEKTLKSIFDELDTNKDQVISLEELSRSIQGVNLRALLEDAGKEELTFRDFNRMMLELYEQEQLVKLSNDI